jgi:hypothetical protein
MRATTGRNVRDGRSGRGGRGGSGRENKKQNTSKHSKHVKKRKNQNRDDHDDDDSEKSVSEPRCLCRFCDHESYPRHPYWACPSYYELTRGRGRACHGPPGSLIREFSDGRYYDRGLDGHIWCLRCRQYVGRFEELSEDCRETLGGWVKAFLRGD